MYKNVLLKRCFSSVAKSCPTLCDPMDCSTPGFPVLHYVLELAQTHVHRVSDAIQPSHPLSLPSPPAFNLSQHQGWVLIKNRKGKKDENRRIDAFKLCCWRRLLRAPCTARRSKQSILKEINPEYLLEGQMLKLKLQHLPPDSKSWLIGEDRDAGKDWGQEEKRATEDKMVGWHHWLNGHEFKQLQEIMKGRET